MAIVEKQVIRFAPTRKLQGRSIDLGNAGDNMVRRLMFALPEVDGAQTATLMYGGKYADMIQLTYEDGKWATDLTAEMIGEAGEVEGYVRVDGPQGEKWHSDAFRLVTGEVPQIEVQIEKLYPTAVDQMLTAMAEHKTEMDAAVKRAEAAADRAEASGGGGGTGGEAGKDGEDGGYYQPSVSSSGNLSWTASKPDMPGVATVNIRGPQGIQGETGERGPAGQDGYTPVKGVDYFDGTDGSPGKDGRDGENGFSPTVAVTEITGGHRVTITDVNGPTSFDVADGKDGAGGSGGSGADGEDGGYYQPSVNADGDLSWSASKAGMPTVATVNIRGPEGRQGVQGEPGSDGQAGKDGDPGQDGFSPTVTVTDITGGHRVTITDATGAKSIDVMDGAAGQNGSPGQDGQDGQDGFSPTVSVSTIAGGHQVSVTDASGAKTFNVMDGSQGPQGIQGPEGPQGPAGSDATVTVDSTVTSGGTNPVNSAAVIAYAMPVTAIVFTETDPGEDTASSYPDGTVVLVP